MRCAAFGRHALFEVFGASTTLLIGIFCAPHWAGIRQQYRDAGGRTALTVLPESEGQQCCADGDDPRIEVTP